MNKSNYIQVVTFDHYFDQARRQMQNAVSNPHTILYSLLWGNFRVSITSTWGKVTMATDISDCYQYKLGMILGPTLSSESRKLVLYMLSWGLCYPTIRDTVISGTARFSNADLANLKGVARSNVRKIAQPRLEGAQRQLNIWQRQRWEPMTRWWPSIGCWQMPRSAAGREQLPGCFVQLSLLSHPPAKHH